MHQVLPLHGAEVVACHGQPCFIVVIDPRRVLDIGRGYQQIPSVEDDAGGPYVEVKLLHYFGKIRIVIKDVLQQLVDDIIVLHLEQRIEDVDEQVPVLVVFPLVISPWL